jgi:hypothetical protein
MVLWNGWGDWTVRRLSASWLEKNFWLEGPRYDNVVPPCEVGLDKIAYGFATKEGRFWNSDLRIVAFEGVRETAFDPWAPQTIPRRYCTAVCAGVGW